MLWLRVKIKAKGTSVGSEVVCYVLAKRLRVGGSEERRTEFVMCWLRVYAWLRVKIKAKGTGVGGVLPWSLDERTR